MEQLTPVTLIVKAPNQKVEDRRIACNKGWTVRQLKEHLSTVYPEKPVCIACIASTVVTHLLYCDMTGTFALSILASYNIWIYFQREDQQKLVYYGKLLKDESHLHEVLTHVSKLLNTFSSNDVIRSSLYFCSV